MSPVLEVRGLCKKYDSFTAVDGLNMTVDRGDIYGFLGPNGAGKSTTIRMLSGLIRPTSGSIRMFGSDFSDNRIGCMRRVGAIVEKPDFYRYLTAKKNLLALSRINGIRNEKSRIAEVIELVGLKGREDDLVKTYSHGMKQRLGLAQALMHDPDLIILDEPTTGLDPQGIIDLRNLILFLRDKGKTILMSSHILHEVELVATRMVIISKGKAVAEGKVVDLLDADDLVVAFEFNDVHSARLTIETSEWNQHLVKQDASSIRFKLKQSEIALLNKWLCANGVEVKGISALRKLEEYFMRLTG